MKNINKISLYIALLFLWTACDTEGDNYEGIRQNQRKLSIKLVYGSDNITSSDFNAKFLGRDISSSYFEPEEHIGTLEIFEKGNSTPVLTNNNYDTEKEGLSISLIKLPNNPVEIYHKENFMKIMFNEVESGYITSNYTVFFNNREIHLGNDNYFRYEKEISGTLKFYAKNSNDTKPIFESAPVHVRAGDPLSILKIEDKDEFIIFKSEGADGKVTPPEDITHTKVRFLWKPGVSSPYKNLDSVSLEVITTEMNPDTFEDVVTLVPRLIIKKNELSDYIDLEIKSIYAFGAYFHTGFFYKLYDLDGNPLFEFKKEIEASLGLNFQEDKVPHWSFYNKFQTVYVNENLSGNIMKEKWEVK